jgi:hypothetical protein
LADIPLPDLDTFPATIERLDIYPPISP